MIQRPENWGWEWEYKPTQLRDDCLAGLGSLRVFDADRPKPRNLRHNFYAERVWVQNRHRDIGLYAWSDINGEGYQWRLVCYMPKPVDESTLLEAALNIVRLGLDTASYGEEKRNGPTK